MFALLLISFAAASAGESSTCNNYCKLLSAGQFTGPKWDVHCICDPEKQKNFLKSRKELKYNADGIYYEPVDNNRIPDVSLIYQPFIILNPTLRDRFLAESFGAMKSNDHGDEKNKHTKHNIKRKTKDITYNRVHVQVEKQPVYLDLEISKPVAFERNSQKEMDSINNFDLTEKILMDCIDLYFLKNLRANDNVSGLKLIWDDDKIKMYDGLTDKDLEREIDKKCNQPVKTLEHSLNEIKANIPKTKNLLDITLNEVSPSNARNADNENQQLINETIDENQNSDYEMLATERYTEDYEDKETSFEIISTTSESSQTLTIYPLVETDNSENTSNFETVHLAMDESNYNKSENEKLLTYHDISSVSDTNQQNNVIIENPSTINFNEITTQGTITVDQAKFEINSNMSSYNYSDSSVTNTQFDKNSKSGKVSSIHADILDNQSSSSNTHSSTLGNDLEINYETTIATENNNLHDQISFLKENRTVYLENEIKMPSIIVTDYPNGTMSSEVDGNEELLNNDFTNMNSEITEPTNISSVFKINHLQNDFTNNIDETKLKQPVNANSPVPELTKTGEVTGKLYFLFRQNYVPVRFVQNPDGNINIGIDGKSLCDELINGHEVNTSIIAILCKKLINTE